MKELTAEEARKIVNNFDVSYAQGPAYNNVLEAIHEAARKGQNKIHFPDYSDTCPEYDAPSRKAISSLAKRLEQLGYNCTCRVTTYGVPSIEIHWS